MSLSVSCMAAALPQVARGSGFASGSVQLSAAAPRRASHAAAAPRAMADGDKAAAPTMAKPKVAEFRALSDTLVMLEIQAAKKELVLLNVKKATRQEVKAHHFVLLRKKVAMLKTIRRERELEAGIKKRESRQADKAVKLDKTFW